MYAIIRTGGKQYRVKAGDTIHVERLSAETGASVTLGEVLLLGGEGGIQVGSPVIAGAKVSGTVIEMGRGHKVRVLKYKKRKHYRRTRGHRQDYTAVRVDKVEA